MKCKGLSLLVALLGLALPPSAHAGGPPIRSDRIDRAVTRVQPSVVKIFGVKGFRGVFGYMTGVIVHKSGLVLTRNSVTLEEAPRITCHLHDGRLRGASIVREDRRSKMVLLKLEGEEGETYPVAPLGDSDKTRAGRFVMLIGNAYKVALGRERCAVNLGLVSAKGPIRMRSGLANQSFDYDGDVILHDAMNNPGVFGGPLVNLKGLVIGISGRIVESRETNQQVHYAIPINDLKPFIKDTVERPDAGRIYAPAGTKSNGTAAAVKIPGYHGIRVLRSGINRATPAYVDRIERNSPAAEAGMRPDDLVLKIDQSRVKSWRSFNRIIKGYNVGEKVQITVKRGELIKIISFTLSKRP